MRDLQPYVCTFKDCILRPFSFRHEWFEHELVTHRKVWRCDRCFETFMSAVDFRKHLERDHEGSHLAENQLNILTKKCEQCRTHLSPFECPLCDAWGKGLQRLNGGGDNIVVTLEEFERHLGKHLETLALFAIPRWSSYPEEDDQANEKDSNMAAADYMQEIGEVITEAPSVFENEDSEGPVNWELCEAATNGELERVKSLFERSEYGEEEVKMAATAAASSGQVSVVEYLVSHYPDADAWCLHAAVKKGRENIVKVLADRWTMKPNSRDDSGLTALYHAAVGGYYNIVELLLLMGADVNAQGGYYGNALQGASSGGHESVVRLLLEWGADVNAQGGYYGNALQGASSGGHESVVQLLLEWGADVNAQGGYYGNALQGASSGGHESVVQLLLGRGADVNAQGGYYGNALQGASSGGHESVVRLLLERGADVDGQGGYYGSALQAASSGGHESVVRLLLERGADVNGQGGYYGSALQAASYGGHESVVLLLLEWGADVNGQGGHYDDALCAASSGGHGSVVQLLLERGAGVTPQGEYDDNALLPASSEGHQVLI
jgi:ankyrin repeat protein